MKLSDLAPVEVAGFRQRIANLRIDPRQLPALQPKGAQQREPNIRHQVKRMMGGGLTDKERQAIRVCRTLGRRGVVSATNELRRWFDPAYRAHLKNVEGIDLSANDLLGAANFLMRNFGGPIAMPANQHFKFSLDEDGGAGQLTAIAVAAALNRIAKDKERYVPKAVDAEYTIVQGEESGVGARR